MKQFKTLVIAVVLAVGSMSFVSAQSKVAHVDVQQLVSDMPEMKAAQAELQKLQGTYKTDIDASVQALQSKMKTYQTEAATKSQDENQKRAQEVEGMQQSIMQAQQQAQQELSQKEMELLKPILEKANAAILKVGKAQGFDYVLDSSTGSGVILAGGKDLLADVKKELGF